MTDNYYGMTKTDLKLPLNAWKELVDNIISCITDDEVAWLFCWDMTEKASSFKDDSERGTARYYHYVGYFDCNDTKDRYNHPATRFIR